MPYLSNNYCAATGGKATGVKDEVVYDEPDDLQQYKLKGDTEIDLQDCPAYGKPNRREDIELKECPAYVERKDINLQECPAYEESRRPVDKTLII